MKRQENITTLLEQVADEVSNYLRTNQKTLIELASDIDVSVEDMLFVYKKGCISDIDIELLFKLLTVVNLKLNLVKEQVIKFE